MGRALILEPDVLPSVGEAGPVLAGTLGLPLADATATIRYGGGILLEDDSDSALGPGALEEARRRLAAIGVRTAIVDSRDLPPARRARRAVGLDFLDDTLLARSVLGPELVLARSEIRAFHLFALPATPRREEGQGGRSGEPGSGTAGRKGSRGSSSVPASLESAWGLGISPRGRRLLERAREQELGDLRYAVSIHALWPAEPVRIESDLFDFSCLGHGKLAYSLDNFLLLIEDLLDWAPDTWNRSSIERFLGELDPTRISCEKREVVARFDRWVRCWMAREPLKGGRP